MAGHPEDAPELHRQTPADLGEGGGIVARVAVNPINEEADKISKLAVESFALERPTATRTAAKERSRQKPE